MGKMTRFLHFLWNAAWPLLLYELISGVIYLTGWMIIDLVGAAAGAEPFLSEDSAGQELILSTVGSLTAAFPLWFLYSARRREWGEMSGWEARFPDMACIAALGASLCVFGNLLVLYLPVSWEGYEAISDTFYDPPVTLQLICVGLAVPLAEEILFRGVIYGWLRRSLPAFPAIVLSAVLFGVWHGNMVQAVYASVLGLGLAWLMERYGTLAAPYLLHLSANMMSVLTSNTFLGILIDDSSAGMLETCTAVSVLLILAVNRHAPVRGGSGAADGRR